MLSFAVVNAIGSGGDGNVNAIQQTAVGSGFFNITAIKVNRPIPGVTVTVGSEVTTPGAAQYILSTNRMAVLAPAAGAAAIYPTAGQTYSSLTTAGSTAVTYNQQNGQPTTTFTLAMSDPTG